MFYLGDSVRWEGRVVHEERMEGRVISPLGIIEDKRLVRDAHPTKATKSERLVDQGSLAIN